MLSVIRDIGREREREYNRLFLSLNYANPGHLTVANDDVAGRGGGENGTSKCAMYLDNTYMRACVFVCVRTAAVQCLLKGKFIWKQMNEEEDEEEEEKPKTKLKLKTRNASASGSMNAANQRSLQG